MVALSVLDLAPIGSGSSASQALHNMEDLAALAERLGYTRFWLAEHHGLPSIASSSPEVLIEHVASATKRIRVGSGGIMLPNHAPLRIVEAFHTLEALHPGRIDLGIGRAPGTNPETSRALRRFDAEQFPSMMTELLALSQGNFPEDHPFHSVKAVPDDVSLPPVWILGSSGASARFAGSLGLGYSFAHHFSPTPPAPPIRAYRENFEPSDLFEQPHVILAVSVVCAETEAQADYLAGSMDLSWVRRRQGQSGRLPSPDEAADYEYSPAEQAIVDKHRSLIFVGTPGQVRTDIEAVVEETGADEVMVSSLFYGHRERMQSYELLADAFNL